MTHPSPGLPLSCREATAALALVTAATEPRTLIVGFTSGAAGICGGSSGIAPLNISPRQRLDDAIRAVSDLPFGGTDCALPDAVGAAERRRGRHVLRSLTDNETWAGQIHPHQALDQYRREDGHPGPVGRGRHDLDKLHHRRPEDPGSLDVCRVGQLRCRSSWPTSPRGHLTPWTSAPRRPGRITGWLRIEQLAGLHRGAAGPAGAAAARGGPGPVDLHGPGEGRRLLAGTHRLHRQVGAGCPS